MKRKIKENFALFCILLVFITVGVISFFWNANSFFTGAYRPTVERSIERERIRKAEDEDASVEPHSYGLREKDIKKERGNGFSTY